MTPQQAVILAQIDRMRKETMVILENPIEEIFGETNGSSRQQLLEIANAQFYVHEYLKNLAPQEQPAEVEP